MSIYFKTTKKNMVLINRLIINNSKMKSKLIRNSVKNLLNDLGLKFNFNKI